MAGKLAAALGVAVVGGVLAAGPAAATDSTLAGAGDKKVEVIKAVTAPGE
ncbi:hypothetical protein GCM10010452_58120 [Crossiella cryophila]